MPEDNDTEESSGDSSETTDTIPDKISVEGSEVNEANFAKEAGTPPLDDEIKLDQPSENQSKENDTTSDNISPGDAEESTDSTEKNTKQMSIYPAKSTANDLNTFCERVDAMATLAGVDDLEKHADIIDQLLRIAIEREKKIEEQLIHSKSTPGSSEVETGSEYIQMTIYPHQETANRFDELYNRLDAKSKLAGHGNIKKAEFVDSVLRFAIKRENELIDRLGINVDFDAI